MSAMTVMSFPTQSALRNVRIPPLVHPSVLQAAAEHCAQFGGNREALNAAALAASLLQSQWIEARKAVGKPLNDPPKDGASREGGAQGYKGWSTDLDSSPQLSEQAKQAMAAAQATNTLNSKKDKDKEKSKAAGVAPAPLFRMQESTFPGSQSMAEAAAAAAAPRLSLNPGVPFPSVNNVSAMAPTMPPPPVPLTMPPPAPILQPPPIIVPELPQLPQLPPPARERPPPRESRLQPAPPEVPQIKVPPPKAPPREGPPGKEPAQEEKREEKKDGEEKKKAEDEKDDLRCHLHRKPQLNCKICRRIHYSALDPSIAQKEDRGKERSAADKNRRSNEGDDVYSIRKRSHDVFEIQNKQTFNFNAMLRDQILKNTYFKSIMNIDTFEAIVDEMYQYAETAEVYGGGTTTVPSTLFCCLFRLFTIGISYDELNQLLENQEWPYVRCCGFLYIRFGCSPDKLWEHLGEYCLDDQEFEPSKSSPGFKVSIGEYVEALLMDERYYYTALPRIPVGVKKRIEEKVAPLAQYRRRAVANNKSLHLFREPGTPVEVVTNSGEWLAGEVLQLDERITTRIQVRVQLEDGYHETQHIGKVILRDVGRGRGRGRSRSRSPRRGQSPDWTRTRGMSTDEMLQDLRARQRERAVCSSGKDYARKPIGFMSGLALKRDMGLASTRLREEETYAPRQVEHRRQMTEEDEHERRREERARLEADREQASRMQQLYEKYGAAHPAPSGPTARKQDADVVPDQAPDVLRLG